MKSFILSAFLMLSAWSAQAGILQPQGELKKIEGISIASTATTTVNGQSVTLTTVASGLRKKMFGPLGTPIYVLSILVDQPQVYVKSEQALASLDQANVVALRLEFTYNPDAPTIANAFTDALTANGITNVTGEMAAFLEAVKNGGEVNTGDSITIILSKNASAETLTYESTTGIVTPIQGAPGFAHNVLSMWLGNIAASDKGLKKLKEELIK